MADFDKVAEQFIQFYYNTFDGDRSALANLYRDNSMMTFENQPMQGKTTIVEKLVSLPFQKIAHIIDTHDAQPANEQGGILVLVTGKLKTDDDPPKSFIQTFQLVRDAQGTYFVFNDMFRLDHGISGFFE